MNYDLVATILSKSVIDEVTGCFNWAGYVDSDGRARMRFSGVRSAVARILMRELKGTVGNLFVLHTCDNRKCINPGHLFLGTQKENLRDMHHKGRARNGKEGMTHCMKGHELTLDNTYIYLRAGRYRKSCRECSRQRNREHRKKLKVLGISGQNTF